jgi:hypothetical protein
MLFFGDKKFVLFHGSDALSILGGFEREKVSFGIVAVFVLYTSTHLCVV